MEGDKLNGSDPFAIHVMQIIIGSRSARFHLIFLKSLIWHHFEQNEQEETSAAPVHLHLLTDEASRYIVEGILGSWRIRKLHFSFYPAETYQARIGWMRSNHKATRFATMKIYIPEILSSAIPKVIALDTDCLFMTDIVHLWNQFDQFKPSQFFAMAPEPYTSLFDLTQFGGGKQSFSYNGGVVLWYLQRINKLKWNVIWKTSYKRAVRAFNMLPAAEQTLMTVVAMDNPETFFQLSCLWNLQLYKRVLSDLCPSTWNRPQGPDVLGPFLVHADRTDKLETSFSLLEPKTLATNVNDLVDRYVFTRSRFNQLDGYTFRHAPLDSPAFSFSTHMKTLHPDGKIMNRLSLCHSKWIGLHVSCGSSETLNFVSEHRIHPLFFSHNHTVITNNEHGVTLTVSLNVSDILIVVSLAEQWTGWMSVALYGTDEEALSSLVFLEKSNFLNVRKNILFHYVYKSELYPESVTLHNVAVLYSPTRYIFAIPRNHKSRILPEEMVSKHLEKNDGESVVFTTPSPELACIGNKDNVCIMKPDAIMAQQEKLKEKIQGVLIRTGSSLLPAELAKSDRATQILALVANAAFK